MDFVRDIRFRINFGMSTPGLAVRFSGFSTGNGFQPSRGYLKVSGDVFSWRHWEGLLEASHAANHPRVNRAALHPHNRHYPTGNVSGVKVRSAGLDVVGEKSMITDSALGLRYQQ